MDSNKVIPPGGGWMQQLGLNIRLIASLFLDRNVPILLKLLPLTALIYLVFPDFFAGPFDDLVILGICFYLFVELSPEKILLKHKEELTEKFLSSYQTETLSDRIEDEIRSLKENKRQ